MTTFSLDNLLRPAGAREPPIQITFTMAGAREPPLLQTNNIHKMSELATPDYVKHKHTRPPVFIHNLVTGQTYDAACVECACMCNCVCFTRQEVCFMKGVCFVQLFETITAPFEKGETMASVQTSRLQRGLTIRKSGAEHRPCHVTLLTHKTVECLLHNTAVSPSKVRGANRTNDYNARAQ